MKRFHVHLQVDDFARSIGFYSKLFAADPARVEARAEAADMALLDEGLASRSASPSSRRRLASSCC